MPKTILLMLCVLVACAAPVAPAPIASSPTVPLTPSPRATATSTPAPTATRGPLQVYLPPLLPNDLRDALRQVIESHAVGKLAYTPDQHLADLVLTTTWQTGTATLAAEWVYAVAAPFPTLADAVSSTQVIRFWEGQPEAMASIANNGVAPRLFVTTDTLRAMTDLFGKAPAPNVPVQVVAQEKLVDSVWAARPAAWAIVPFDQLDPRLKVLTVDGVSLLSRNGNTRYWPAVRVLALPPKRAEAQGIVEAFLKSGGLRNRDQNQMTILAMTGVTALVRDTAWVMERKGVLYPGEKIKSWLTTADVVHISNEVSFNPDCPAPEFLSSGMIFCSAPKYFDLLKDVRARVIENTGNHLNDYGWRPFLYTLSLYEQAGMVYFGGGRTITEAQKAITITDHGNVLGFVGCNPVGPPIAWVDGLKDGRPGSAPCRSPFPVMQAEIQKLKAAGALPIATLQYWEQPLGDYTYETAPVQVTDFRQLVEAGAAIVSGSQAHQPQGFDFYLDGFIHYGLGNLFFDQAQTLGVRQTFVDRYVIYQGRVLSVELLTGIREPDNFAQPRPMTAAERRAFLQTIFKASGW